MEKFAKPAVGAIIEKEIDGEKFILVQERQKEYGGKENGMLEIPAGKIREYENVFEALRREVKEETGLIITKINGEECSAQSCVNGNKVISFQPYCVTQNLSGAYSLILNTFLCEAEGVLAESTDETQNIHWQKADFILDMLKTNPDSFFLMHVNALKKYFKLL
ncbi:NUDIX domain-containing protein [Clostridium sp. P21]|uniref:NUDIX domain-containing protein n=1 Tax=Clostridium muellerianum TaxID=2716538 RepID=A0A7Y0EHK7_9CLOT|nr:NUDIX domain-containing protein [Clostridium muellerianum]NMM63619.1 NUDIX domain-containing protein [Clostridium muellerianum]